MARKKARDTLLTKATAKTPKVASSDDANTAKKKKRRNKGKVFTDWKNLQYSDPQVTKGRLKQLIDEVRSENPAYAKITFTKQSRAQLWDGGDAITRTVYATMVRGRQMTSDRVGYTPSDLIAVHTTPGGIAQNIDLSGMNVTM